MATIKVTIQENDRNSANITRLIEEIRVPAFVQVGVFTKRARGGITDAHLAATHEFGVPSRNIPERSFLRGTFTKNKRKYERLLFLFLRRAIDGKVKIRRALRTLGTVFRQDVREFLDAGDALPKLKPSTVEEKRGQRLRRSRANVNKPLVRTGRLKKAVSWRLNVKGRIADQGTQ